MEYALHKIAVAGGDRRQIYMANDLSEKGFSVMALGFDEGEGFLPEIEVTEDAGRLKGSDVLILGLPVSDEKGLLHALFSKNKWTLSEVLSALPESCRLFGGRVSEQAQKTAESLGFFIEDYSREEELSILNAVPTAEGALAIALEKLPRTLWKSHCLVLGYGKIGKILAERLKAMGARVTVSARNPQQLAWAQTAGFTAVPISELLPQLAGQDMIFNTIPAVVLTEKHLENITPSCPVVELASKPGGVDLEAAERLNREIIPAPALPGRTAPQTAGELIGQTILHMMNRER